MIPSEDLTHFVPDSAGGTRQETAALLVGTAQEFSMDVRVVKATDGGFFITDELAAMVYGEPEPEPEAEPEPSPAKKRKTTTNKSSGNRAGETATNKE